MLANNNQWVLFGVDLSRMLSLFVSSWQMTFMAPDSKVRAALDEPVGLFEKVETQWSKKVIGSDVERTKASAYLVPESMTLMRQLKIPRSINIDIETVVTAEVRDASPFLPEDTAFGWICQTESKEQNLVDVAIVSKSAILAFLTEEVPLSDLSQEEVWVRSGTEYIVVTGFGEKSRLNRYAARLKKIILYIAACVVCLTGILSVPLMYKHFEAKELRASLVSLQLQSKGAMQARSNLANVNGAMKELNQSLRDSVSVVASLEYLTNTLPDDSWLSLYEQKGNKIQISGTSKHAANLMQKFTDHELLFNVKSPSAIRKVGKRGLESFRMQYTVKILAKSGG